MVCAWRLLFGKTASETAAGGRGRVAFGPSSDFEGGVLFPGKASVSRATRRGARASAAGGARRSGAGLWYIETGRLSTTGGKHEQTENRRAPGIAGRAAA